MALRDENGPKRDDPPPLREPQDSEETIRGYTTPDEPLDGPLKIFRRYGAQGRSRAKRRKTH